MLHYVFFTACYIHVNDLYTIVLCTAVASKLVGVIDDEEKCKPVNHDHSSLIAMIMGGFFLQEEFV